MMMPEQALPILHEVKDDDDIDQQDHEDSYRKSAHQLVNFNRNKKDRFADGHPTGPTYAKNQPDSLHEREQAVKRRPSGNPKEIRWRDFPDLLGQLCKKLPFRVNMNPVQRLAIIMNQIVVGQAVDTKSQQQQQYSLAHLDRDNGVKGWRALCLFG